jgi:hypothetical protein
MDKQMEMAFMQQGGLKDDGMKQDPISGNPIPDGSMAKEVRDDIPAQLSEGEYVVPADVVRYYGVKHFEDIRNNAKRGLQQMEANGRIGGEPVPVGGPVASDLNPEEMAELQSMMMNIGGFIDQPADPYQQQRTMYKQPMVMGASNGPDVSGSFSTNYYDPNNPNAMTKAITTASPKSGSFSESPAQQAAKAAAAEVAEAAKVENKVTLYGPNGEEVSVILPSEEYNKYISQGYTATKPVTPKDDDPRNPRSPFKDTENEGLKNWGKEVDWSDPLAYAKSMVQNVENPGFKGRLAKGLGFAVAGFPGAVIGDLLSTSPVMNSLANVKASKLIAEAQGITDFTEYDEMITDLRKKSSGLLGGVFSDFVTDNMAQSFYKTKTPEEWKLLAKPKVTPKPKPTDDEDRDNGSGGVISPTFRPPTRPKGITTPTPSPSYTKPKDDPYAEPGRPTRPSGSSPEPSDKEKMIVQGINKGGLMRKTKGK